MAHLEVKPKSGTPWWVWLLLALIILALLWFFLFRKNSEQTNVATKDTSAMMMGDSKQMATTTPDYDNVDFNSPTTADPDVTDKDIAVRGNDKYTIYSLGENILFATDKSAIQGTADSKLTQILASLNKRFSGASIGVYGNTDAVGDAQHNKQLGAERATAVKNWLVSKGLDSTLVSVRSLGESKPVATNTTATGREQNRNVEIVAFPNGK